MSDQKSSAEQEMRRRILERPNDFITLEDGYVYFWVGGEHRGALAAVKLRLIAQILDEKNAEWDAEVRRYFDEHREG